MRSSYLSTRATAVVLILALSVSGCASAGGGAVQTRGPQEVTVLSGYVKRLPVGSRVHVRLVGSGTVHGSLMQADDRAIVVQPRTRIPEPPREIPLERIASVELDTGNAGRTAAIAVGVGVGSALAFLLVLAAIFSD